MTIESKNEREATHELEDLEVFKVDIVGSPATGDKFIVVRSEDGEKKMPRRAITKRAAQALQKDNQDKEIVSVVAREESVEEIERQVPPADATSERKREAQKKRSQKYGIEVLENKGENLSYPSGDPTTERLYGDPANLKYPLGREDNKVDIARANNARARFKQNFAVYTKTSSRRVIHTRIVKAQLKGGANPSFDPDDKLDQLLPREVREKMQQPVERKENEPETNSEETQMQNLSEGIDRLEKLVERMEGVFTGALGLKTSAPDASGETQEEVAPEEETELETTSETESKEDLKPEGEVPEEDSTESLQETAEEQETSEDVSAPVAEEVTEQAPIQATVEQIEALSKSVSGLATVVERMGKAFETGLNSINKNVEGLSGRINKVERSVRSGGNSEEDETEAPIERGGNNSQSGIWNTVFRG